MRDRSQTIGIGVVIEVTKREKKSKIVPRNIKCKGDVQTIDGIIVKCDGYILNN